MASSSVLVQQWLHNVLKPYPARDRVFADVTQSLAAWPSLAVKTDAFTFDTGQTALLLLLHGTLPITFRGATYHIPLNIWFPLEYPRKPPMVYVVPTKEMGVRKSKEVEPGGRVMEQELEGWERKWEAHTLAALLQSLVAIFSSSPPVYAKPPAGVASPPPIQRVSASPPPRSPSNPSASTSTYTSQQPPAPPQRPHVFLPSNGVALPLRPDALPTYSPSSPLNRSQAPAVPSSPSSSRNAGPPPVPPHPHQSSPSEQPRLPPRPISQNFDPRYARHGSGGYPSAPGQQNSLDGQPVEPARFVPQTPHQHPQYAPQQQQSFQPLQHDFPHQHSQYLNYQQVHAASNDPPMGQPPQQQQLQPPHASFNASIQQPTRRDLPNAASPVFHQPRSTPIPDLLSSDNDFDDSPAQSTSSHGPAPPPPSKPPPPQTMHLHSLLLPRIQSAVPPLLGSLYQTQQQLREVNEDLKSGEPAIRDEMARLEAVRAVCDTVGQRWGAAVAACEERVADLESRGEIGVDEVVCSISIVHNQLIDLVADDNAIEDTIFHLGRALDAERIDLDRFLKATRSLAREQFQKRALIDRILVAMGEQTT